MSEPSELSESSRPLLEVRDLRVSVAAHPEIDIVRGVNLTLRRGEVHALMGPNGSGKSTLANAIAGSPQYLIDSGQVLFHGEDITKLTADARARMGMFLSFQYPTPIPGVTMVNLLRMAMKARSGRGALRPRIPPAVARRPRNAQDRR